MIHNKVILILYRCHSYSSWSRKLFQLNFKLQSKVQLFTLNFIYVLVQNFVRATSIFRHIKLHARRLHGARTTMYVRRSAINGGGFWSQNEQENESSDSLASSMIQCALWVWSGFFERFAKSECIRLYCWSVACSRNQKNTHSKYIFFSLGFRFFAAATAGFEEIYAVPSSHLCCIAFKPFILRGCWEEPTQNQLTRTHTLTHTPTFSI